MEEAEAANAVNGLTRFYAGSATEDWPSSLEEFSCSYCLMRNRYSCLGIDPLKCQLDYIGTIPPLDAAVKDGLVSIEAIAEEIKYLWYRARTSTKSDPRIDSSGNAATRLTLNAKNSSDDIVLSRNSVNCMLKNHAEANHHDNSLK